MKVEERILGYIEEGGQLLVDSKFVASIETFAKADELIKFVADTDMINGMREMCKAGKSIALSNLNISGRKDEDKEAIGLRRNLQYVNERMRVTSKLFRALSLASAGKIDGVIAVADEVLDDLGDDVPNLLGVAELYEYDLDNNYEKAKKALLKARTFLLPRVAESPDIMLNIQHKLANIAQKCEHNNKQAMFECEKGWRFIEEMGIERFETQSATRIALFAAFLEQETIWIRRCNKISGVSLDKGEADSTAVPMYVDTNLVLFVESAAFDETVTIERALRCVELSKDMLDEVGNAKAQCLAGCAIAELGKTKESARKSARLIKPALRVIKKMNDDFAHSMVAVGEGYIANCHFMNEEYDLALELYQSALKGLQSCNDLTRNSFSYDFTNRIKECQKHIR